MRKSNGNFISEGENYVVALQHFNPYYYLW